MLIQQDRSFFSQVPHEASQLRKGLRLNWATMLALTIDAGLWLLIIKGGQFFLNRPFV